MHYVYLMESSLGHKYVGFTADLHHRLADHNAGRLPNTAKYRPWKLATYLGFSSKKQALAFEKYLKSGSGHAFARRHLWPA
jgi:putative endonuclease